MTIMMSDSLKDIVSIGQLSGEPSSVILTIDDESFDLDLFSFTRDATSARVLAFATREIVVNALKGKNLSAKAAFEGVSVAAGKVITVGYEMVFINNDPHDMLMIHIKRNN